MLFFRINNIMAEKARKGSFPDESNITFISSKSKEIMV